MHGKNAAGMAKLKATVWQREMCVVIETVNEKFKTWQQRWSRNFGPVVKVDRVMKEVIQNDEEKEPRARVQG